MTPEKIDDVLESLGLAVAKLSRTVPSAAYLGARELAEAMVVLGMGTPIVAEGWRPDDDADERRRSARGMICHAAWYLGTPLARRRPELARRRPEETLAGVRASLMDAWRRLGLPPIPDDWVE